MASSGAHTRSSASAAPPQARMHRDQVAKQTCVYAAAQSATELRCGDLVDVEWESCWYPGMVTDITHTGSLSITYNNGDFEADVPVAGKPVPP